MKRSVLALLPCVLLSLAHAQQITLDWATETVPANNRVKLAEGGGVFALGTGDNSAVIQRISAAGAVWWTKTLSAPTLYAIDLDVDTSNNVYIYVGFTTGQLDLDPGPQTTLVNPGKVYAKYTSSGQFLWGFSIENTTDLSEDYGAISVDDAGNLYILGDLGEGTYDFDPGPGVYDLVCGDFTIGSYIARYRPDGTLVFADVRTWYGGFTSSRDIDVMRDGSAFYVIQTLDNGGPLSSQIDVDPGPGVFNVYTETQSIMRYDSAFAFQGQAYTNYGDIRLCADAQGDAYLMGTASVGAGFWAVKYSGNGPNLTQVYSTPLTSTGNLRPGDIAPDDQGGCLGMYSNNCTNSVIRFYKMNVSGLVDFSLFINSGTDCTLPGGKGFDVDGNSFYMGTYNNGYVVDFEPGASVLSLPTGNNDGVVARYDWCADAPFQPFDILLPSPICTLDTVTFNVSAFGDASSYTWNTSVWPILSGQGTASITALVSSIGNDAISVIAVNACGSSDPVEVYPVSFYPEWSPLEDAEECYNYNGVIDPQLCPDCTASWQPGGETTPTLSVSITETTTFILTVTSGGCVDTDTLTITIDPCLAVNDATREPVSLSPVPVASGELLRVRGVLPRELAFITSADGRQYPIAAVATGTMAMIATSQFAAGAYTLRSTDGRAWRFVVVR